MSASVAVGSSKLRSSVAAGTCALVALAGAVAVPTVTAPRWEPPAVSASIGLVGTGVLALGSRMRLAAARRWGWGLLGTVLGVVAAFEWAVPVRMALTSSGPSHAAARLLVTTPAPGWCSSDAAYLRSFAALIDARRVCVHNPPGSRAVFVDGASVPSSGVPTDLVPSGLIYAPDGTGPGQTDGVCLRHLFGPWWVFQGLILECPAGMRAVGSG